MACPNLGNRACSCSAARTNLQGGPGLDERGCGAVSTLDGKVIVNSIAIIAPYSDANRLLAQGCASTRPRLRQTGAGGNGAGRSGTRQAWYKAVMNKQVRPS